MTARTTPTMATPSRGLVWAGVFFGLGLGGFFDGIVLHQVLQWHHMLTSAGYPADSLHNLEINTLADGLFHAITYVFVALGLLVLWRSARRGLLRWSGRLLAGSLLVGFGLFNLIEGIVNHHILGIHHVNETVPREQWFWWDLGFLAWGALMLAVGWMLLRRGLRETAAGALAPISDAL
ncbi:DUF2243 domain-containing protein [Falsiroseomonas sp. E2-1-a4]|uniref:DUF2243 domain-containing protein n=1 Tax=Falsiroseomonas sp. E2-1-a4 TaxID=3239299 RepID=UPI003F3C4D61